MATRPRMTHAALLRFIEQTESDGTISPAADPAVMALWNRLRTFASLPAIEPRDLLVRELETQRLLLRVAEADPEDHEALLTARLRVIAAETDLIREDAEAAGDPVRVAKRLRAIAADPDGPGPE